MSDDREKAVTGVARREPVVTGVDGSESALRAVRWAAGEAVRRNRPLRLVHAYAAPGHGYPNPEVTAAELREARWETGIRRLEAAAEVARTTEPSLEIGSEITAGDPRVRLVDESWRAAMVVLGSRGLAGVGRLLLGSSGLALAVHGRCPLVVVRGERPRSGPVVVGVDDWSASVAAARFAFQEAAALGTSVTALRTWRDLEPGGSAATHELLRRSVRRQVALVAADFPDVPWDCLVVRGRPGRVLLEFGARAGLIVVGTRGHSGFGGLLLSSVSQNLTGHASCPVAVVSAGPRLAVRCPERRTASSENACGQGSS